MGKTFKIGDRVEVRTVIGGRFSNAEVWKPGIITFVEDAVYTVKFDNGQRQDVPWYTNNLRKANA